MIHPGESSPLQPIPDTAVLPAIESSPVSPAIIPPPELPPDLEAARRWQWGANALTFVRLAGSIALASHVSRAEQPPRSWTSTVTAAAIVATDYLDGWFARRAKALGGPKSALGAYGDQLTDKVFTNGMQIALAAAHERQGNAPTSRTLQVITAATLARDVSVTALRVATDVTKAPVDTTAKRPGKVKTAAQFVGLVAAMSPLTRNKVFRATTTAAVVGSAYMSVKSGLGYGSTYVQAIRYRFGRPLGRLTEG